MPLLANCGRMVAIVPVAISILTGTACVSASAQSSPAPAAEQTAPAQQTAPIGHVQPNASNVPASVLREENALEAQDTKLDKELNICRGC